MVSWIWTTVLLSLTSVLLLYKYFTRNFDYWKKRNVFYIKPQPFWGNFWDVLSGKLTTGDWLKNLYEKTKQVPYFGIFVFDNPVLVIRSPELVKCVLQRDFCTFDNRSVVTPEHDPVTKNLLFLSKTPKWKILRQKSTPAFTSGKLKKMFPLINGAGDDMRNYLRKHATDKSLEAKEIVSKFSTDVITKCAFGVDAKSFESDEAIFRKVGRCMFDFRIKTAITQMSSFFAPGLARIFKFNFFDKWIVDFLKDSLGGVIKTRQATNDKRHDLVDLLVDIKNDPSNKDIFDDGAILSIALQFFVAGFETTSSTIGFSLYELCVNPDCQKKLRHEIMMAYKENNGKLSHDVIMNMKYLDMVVCEALRMYPVLPFLDRVANADYKIPGHDLVIEKGSVVYIPMTGLHYDEKFFPEPNKFNPERFADKTVLNQGGLYYIPFGEGPRVCIGERFGVLGTKLGLIHILSEFEVEKTKDTPVPIEFEPKSFLLQSKIGLPMRFKPLNASPA